MTARAFEYPLADGLLLQAGGQWFGVRIEDIGEHREALGEHGDDQPLDLEFLGRRIEIEADAHVLDALEHVVAATVDLSVERVRVLLQRLQYQHVVLELEHADDIGGFVAEFGSELIARRHVPLSRRIAARARRAASRSIAADLDRLHPTVPA